MPESNLVALREEFTRRNVLICFNGPVSHGVIEELGTAIRRYLASDAAKGAAAADVFAVYVEFSQNMKAYLERRAFRSPEESAATILVSREGDRYGVTAGNLVANEELRPLLERIDALAKLDASELKSLYRQRLREGPAPGSNGAGVGLIDVARRSGGGIRYETWPVDAEHTLFAITALV
ncbi:MAG TPA: SiaB family protein kinase [Anaeromyxobacteraceae bacterium]|nr:SiaB family protein kinase [Anaeromyxobacteraceae bacterium]